MWWTLNLTPPQHVYMYFGAEVYHATNWRAPSQTASRIWHLFRHCEPHCVLKIGGSLSHGMSEYSWKKIYGCFETRFCNKDRKHKGDSRKQGHKIHDRFFFQMLLSCRMFGSSRYLDGNQLSGPIPRSIGNLRTLTDLWVHWIQWIWSCFLALNSKSMDSILESIGNLASLVFVRVIF